MHRARRRCFTLAMVCFCISLCSACQYVQLRSLSYNLTGKIIMSLLTPKPYGHPKLSIGNISSIHSPSTSGQLLDSLMAMQLCSSLKTAFPPNDSRQLQTILLSLTNITKHLQFHLEQSAHFTISSASDSV